jgi:hypothetical protein
MTPNADLANLSLDGVLKIIGEPSPEERVFAVSLDAPGIGDVTAGAETTISHRDKLLRSESAAESALARDFHRHARSSATLSLIKWLAFSAIAILAIASLLFRIL